MNIASASWGDHLSFGEGDGRLDTPETLARRLRAWRDELGAGVVHWRLLRPRIAGRFSAARGFRHPSLTAARTLHWDDFVEVPRLAREAGLAPWLYVSVFDEGWPLAPARVRAVSYHNAMHGQHVAWQSELTRTHPEWLVVDRTGRRRQFGVVSLAYPEARRAFIERWVELLAPTAFEGLFVCLRSQARPADTGDQFGWNEPAREDYRARYGGDATCQPDLGAWRDLLGSYITQLLVELRAAVPALGRPIGLGVGVPRGDVLGPPLGNATLVWREWVHRTLVDHLVIDQSSSQCPSMWHQLWPMHRGTGYVQNYLEADSLPPLRAHVASMYAPCLHGSGTRLFIARQWTARSAGDEQALLAVPGVEGLVFSTFRHDNPDALRRGDWTAGRVESA